MSARSTGGSDPQGAKIKDVAFGVEHDGMQSRIESERRGNTDRAQGAAHQFVEQQLVAIAIGVQFVTQLRGKVDVSRDEDEVDYILSVEVCQQIE